MSQVFSARWSGVCGECDEGFEAGESVFYNDEGELVHAICPETLPALSPPSGDLCGRCFCYHTGEC